MISYAQLDTIIRAQLDAEASDRYLPQQDIIPAVNSGISRLQAAFGWALANRKGSEEAMRDFTKIGIWQTDNFGSAVVDDPLLTYTIANVLGVYTNPDLQVAATVLPLQPTESRYRSDVAWAGAGDPVRRVTLEQVPVIRTSGSMPGNEVYAANAGRRSYSYYVNNGRVWVLPKSIMGQQFIAIAHIEKFLPMTTVNDTVNLPDYMAQTLASWATSYLVWKQDPTGQGTGAYASKDASELFMLNTN